MTITLSIPCYLARRTDRARPGRTRELHLIAAAVLVLVGQCLTVTAGILGHENDRPKGRAVAARQKLIEDFERKVAHRLPDDYRRFLLAGPIAGWPGEESPENPFTHLLHSLYDFEADEEWRDLSVWFGYRPPSLPEWFLGIGEQYGITIGLGLSGPQRGRVYFWQGDDGEETELAPSFDAFLAWARTREAEWRPGRGGWI